MWVGWGAAFLTKGPPGLLPLLAVIPFVAIRGGGCGVARLFSPAGVAAFLAIGFGWFASEWLEWLRAIRAEAPVVGNRPSQEPVSAIPDAALLHSRRLPGGGAGVRAAIRDAGAARPCEK